MLPAFPHPALVANHLGAWIRAADGLTQAVTRGVAVRAAADAPHLLLGAPVTASRLGYPELGGLDLLELFAFVYPARFTVPTAYGLAATLGLTAPADGAEEAAFLQTAAAHLLAVLVSPDWGARHGAYAVAQSLARHGWNWAPEILRRLKVPARPERSVFTSLEKWEEVAPRPRPAEVALGNGAIDATLDRLLGVGAERRDGQRAYAHAAGFAFRARQMANAPNVVLAEAGTGIGKTLGYLAPAALWAEQAQGTVWLSTYTKALQRQLDHESQRAYPDPVAKLSLIHI
jgi:ATP-dependent DNA helicase DinG